jgi:hypothetical protein
MKSKQHETELAFLGWLNLLNLQSDKLTSLAELKDGVFLLRVLHKM